ncbi:hypothetical protein J0A68_16810 [Algoriphagus sp. H41]|uniref:Uncharacterized protein n=1 Tax=Algoriphagus oliviformis TaxID=2811231 RepID=A0ABS3C667_9BACT|nr:hypothetical protein [Algoriphagus oliviformis]MBN7812618.1 hypothetical protein [Algoriphagus oliviformis]
MLAWVLAVFFFGLGKSLAQDTTAVVIPDGTMGEVLAPFGTLEKEKFPKNINIFTGRWSSLRVGMGFLLGVGSFSNPAFSWQSCKSVGVFFLGGFRILQKGIFLNELFEH